MLARLAAALEGTGLNLFGTAPVHLYDAQAPAHLQSAQLFPRARGLVVVGSAGRALWTAFRAHAAIHPDHDALPHPLDAFVASALRRGDDALSSAGVGFARFEPTIDAPVPLDFRALGALVGFGEEGPFGLLVNAVHGPWLALRGAWLVDVDVAMPVRGPSPCAQCAAPCVGGPGIHIGIERSTKEMRARCPVGVASRYDDAQLAFHYRKVESSG